VARCDLRTAATLVQRSQRILERQSHLLGVPPSRQTLAHELPALDGELALETMCIGGGQALAAVFARV